MYRWHHALGIAAIAAAIFLAYRYQTDTNLGNHDQDIAQVKVTKNNYQQVQQKFMTPWHYTKERRFKMLPRDQYQRALGSHIQLKRSQLPTVKRDSRINVDPAGWHNYKFTTSQFNGKPYVTWLYNRGHLVGYQFCGLNDELHNLVTETTYLNQGSLTGMNDRNPKAMLFYENRLRQWLNTHPQDKLDYAVIPLYRKSELVPRRILLSFVGLKPSNKQVKIKIGGLSKKHGKITQVTLNNSSPQAVIDYQTGRARVTSIGKNKPHRQLLR